MIIFKIFAIPSLIKDAKEASSDPAKFGARFLIKEVRGIAISVFIVVILLLIVTFIFGYTSFIAGPYGIVKFFFWLFAVPSFFLVPFLIFSIRSANKALNNFPKKIVAKEI